MKVAGGFSDCDWYSLAERLPRMVGILVDNPDAKDFQGYGTAREGDAVRPRIAELARGLGFNYVSPQEQARLKKEKEKADADAAAAAAAPATTGNAQVDCMAKVQVEWTKRHKAELDKAGDSQDTATLMRLSMEMNAEAMQKCMPQ